jgi:hypothetical protein
VTADIAVLAGLSPATQISPAVASCVLHKTHRPAPWLLQLHHVILQAWTQKLGLEDSRKVPLCGIGHDAVHLLLRWMIAATGEPFPYYISPAMKALVDEPYGFYLDHKAALEAHGITGMEHV